MKHKFYKTLTISFCLFSLTAANYCFADTASNNSMSFESWVERLRNQAFDKGISVETLQNTFLHNQQMDLSSPVQPQQISNLSNLQNHLTFSKLLKQQYSDILFEISHLFGVNVEALVAIASIENETIENYSAIDILINQSFAQPRNKNLQNELLQALKIIDERQIDAQQLKSDITGKLGKTHFKPSVFRDYAIDFDGDGRYDIWRNYPDIFASTANYLNKIGWKSGQAWAIEVALPEEFDTTLININLQKSLAKWQQLGLIRTDGNEMTASQELGSLIQLENQKYYIVLDNYFALLRWKRSAQYAYTVGQLIELMQTKATAFKLTANPE